MRVYAIGDIHGCSELLDLMVEAIREDLAAHPARDALTVTLGDYIDRGPDSRGVLDRLARNPFPTDYVALKGNHEQMLETFLRDPATAPHWLMNGAGGNAAFVRCCNRAADDRTRFQQIGSSLSRGPSARACPIPVRT